MNRTLGTLLRLREHARKESDAAVRQAEAARDAQQAKVEGIRAAVLDARGAVDEGDALELTAYHAWRLRQEVAARREQARLSQKERELENQRNRHAVRVREELAIGNVIEAQGEAEKEERRRVEGRELDERGGGLRDPRA